MLDDNLWGTQARTGIAIIHSGNLSLTLLMITILLNELDDTWSLGATARVLKSGCHRDDPGLHIRWLFECEDTALERWLERNVYLGNWSVKVEASREWILIEWEEDSTTLRSIAAPQHGSVQKARACAMLYSH
jgi:hypothetical protein